MSHDDMYKEISRARDKTYELIDIVKTGNLVDIGTFVDSLNENESKLVLRMVLLGEWKRLAD